MGRVVRLGVAPGGRGGRRRNGGNASRETTLDGGGDCIEVAQEGGRGEGTPRRRVLLGARVCGFPSGHHGLEMERKFEINEARRTIQNGVHLRGLK